jgi:hypothetical protein
MGSRARVSVAVGIFFCVASFGVGLVVESPFFFPFSFLSSFLFLFLWGSGAVVGG